MVNKTNPQLPNHNQNFTQCTIKIYNGKTEGDNIVITDLREQNKRGTRVEVIIRLKK